MLKVFASGTVDEIVPVAVRFLDNVIGISGYPLAAQRKEAMAKRRIGLGLTGLADALVMCGKTYGSDEAQQLARRWMAQIEVAAYRASAALAAENHPMDSYEVRLLDRCQQRLHAEAADDERRVPQLVRAPEVFRCFDRRHTPNV